MNQDFMVHVQQVGIFLTAGGGLWPRVVALGGSTLGVSKDWILRLLELKTEQLHTSISHIYFNVFCIYVLV